MVSVLLFALVSGVIEWYCCAYKLPCWTCVDSPREDDEEWAYFDSPLIDSCSLETKLYAGDIDVFNAVALAGALTTKVLIGSFSVLEYS